MPVTERERARLKVEKLIALALSEEQAKPNSPAARTAAMRAVILIAKHDLLTETPAERVAAQAEQPNPFAGFTPANMTREQIMAVGVELFDRWMRRNARGR